jgi:hypothetical protein
MTGQTLDARSIEPLDEIPLPGYINGIAVGPKARFCVVAVGQEPRLGRWNRVAGAKNRFGIVRLRSKEDVENDNDEDIDPMEGTRYENESESSHGSDSQSDSES